MQRLKRENKRLEEENQILRKAAAFLLRGWAVSSDLTIPEADKSHLRFRMPEETAQ